MEQRGWDGGSTIGRVAGPPGFDREERRRAGRFAIGLMGLWAVAWPGLWDGRGLVSADASVIAGFIGWLSVLLVRTKVGWARALGWASLTVLALLLVIVTALMVRVLRAILAEPSW